jgi:hypothetical protein
MCRRSLFQLIACIGALGVVGGCGDGSGSGAPSSLAEPCDIDSGHPGDELCIRPPAPEEGFQIHFGPRDYDPATVEPFLIYPGEENVECIFLNTPNDVDIWASEFRGRMRPGTHHMITYTVNEDVENADEPSPCRLGAVINSQFLLGSQEPTIDISAHDSAPEHQGYALPIRARQQLRVELHYINTTSEPILREAWINVGITDPDQVEKEMGPLFWIAQVTSSIPERTEGHLWRGSAQVPQDAPPDLEIMQITGHFHANTQRMSAWLADTSRPAPCTKGDEEGCTLVYEGYDYNDPGWTIFDSVTQNPEADPDQWVAGGDYNGNLDLVPGQRIDWECEIDNPHDFDMGFGNEVETAEMCNVFGTYAPSTHFGGGPWNVIVF